MGGVRTGQAAVKAVPGWAIMTARVAVSIRCFFREVLLMADTAILGRHLWTLAVRIGFQHHPHRRIKGQLSLKEFIGLNRGPTAKHPKF